MPNMRDMKQEDVEVPVLPPLVDLLLDLQEMGMSIFMDRETDYLHITPHPSEDLLLRVRVYYPQLAHLLPGVCEACFTWSIKRTDAYWDAHPHLCPQCVKLALEIFEDLDQWPSPNFPGGS